MSLPPIQKPIQEMSQPSTTKTARNLRKRTSLKDSSSTQPNTLEMKPKRNSERPAKTLDKEAKEDDDQDCLQDIQNLSPSNLPRSSSSQLLINNLYRSNNTSGAKIIPKSKAKLPSQNQTPLHFEYTPVDIPMAVEFVISKSKIIKDKIENDELTEQFLNDSLRRNKTFKISYDSLLQKLINQRQINADFKNVQLPTFQKLEKYFLNQINKFQTNQKIHQQYIIKSRNIQQRFGARIKELQDSIEREETANNEWIF